MYVKVAFDNKRRYDEDDDDDDYEDNDAIITYSRRLSPKFSV